MVVPNENSDSWSYLFGTLQSSRHLGFVNTEFTCRYIMVETKTGSDENIYDE